MARKLRLEYAGACYHVLNRGNYRRDLFAGKGAAESFEACLFETSARFGWRLHAFVIMRNHFHLAVETPEPNLSEGMKWLQGTWAVRFNRFRAEAGRPFQGRYKALHVEPGHALAQVAHYIHLNPVRAKVATAEQLRDFRWSSLPRFIGKDRPAGLEATTVLAESGGLPDTAAGWRRYIAYLEVLAEEEGRTREEKFGRLSRGWVVGSKEFKAGLKKELGVTGRGRLALLGADREAHREMRAELWEERLLAGAKALDIKLDELPARKSAAGKVQLATFMKTTSSVSNGWLADRLQMGKAASVSQYVRRFRLEGKHESRALRKALSIFTT
ncbi:MAG: transposase [Opitutaceae bacterium]